MTDLPFGRGGSPLQNLILRDIKSTKISALNNELGLDKIWTEIYEFDNKKFELYTKIGFKQDSFLREQYFIMVNGGALSYYRY